MSTVSAQLDAALREHAARGRTAFVSPAGATGYREFAVLVDRAAAAIDRWRLPPGTPVGIAAPKSVPMLAALVGALRAGVCACCMEPRLGADATAERVREFGIRRLIVDRTVEPDYAWADPDALCRLDGLIEAGDRSPGAEPAALPAPDDLAMMLFTSGSTGRPKAITLTQANLAAHATGVLDRTRLTPDDRLLHLMPLHHTNGVNNQILVPLLAGASVALVERFDATAVGAQLAAYDPTIVTGVPTMYLRMLPHLDPDRPRGRLRFLRCGSAPITVEQQRRIEDAFGVPLILSYGLSEATCTSTMNPPDAPRAGSVGTALSGQTVRILAPDGDTEVPAGVEGEVCIAGPTLMAGYLGDSAADPIRGGWLRTGDLGRLDADGYLTITGRLKDVIIRGGENIVPGTIEAVLGRHHAVEQCAVVAAPHPDLGQVPHAYVVAADGARPTETELREHVRAELSRSYVPERIRLLDRLPVNRVGKIDRAALSRAAHPS